MSRLFLPLPDEVRVFLHSVEQAVGVLQCWDQQAPHVLGNQREAKRFTLDGRMVGDIGEVLVERYFAVRLEKNQKAGYDGIMEADGATKVEIKVTRNEVYQFRKITDRVIALSLDSDTNEVEIVFNGPGALLVDNVSRMRDRSEWKDDHWAFDQPFNVKPAHIRGLAAADHQHRVPLRAGITPVSRP